MPELFWLIVLIVVAVTIVTILSLIVSNLVVKHYFLRETNNARKLGTGRSIFGTQTGMNQQIQWVYESLNGLRQQVNALSASFSKMETRVDKLESTLSDELAASLAAYLRGQALSPTNVLSDTVKDQAITALEPRPGEEGRLLFAVVTELLGELNAGGRTSDVARINGLQSWLSQRAPWLRADPILFSGDLWLLVVITEDLKKGLVIPTLDTVVGPGEVFRWFHCKLYDGTQSLKRADIASPAVTVRDSDGTGWSVAEKGRIDLTNREDAA